MHFERWAITHCAGKKLANGLGASRPERYALNCNECIETFDVNKTLQIFTHLFEIVFLCYFLTINLQNPSFGRCAINLSCSVLEILGDADIGWYDIGKQ